MRPVEVADEDRAAYHAAASIAANFLVTLEGQAERLAATAGVPRELLVPLARAALENWAANGAEQALTGPVARGDEATIARQRAADRRARTRPPRHLRCSRGRIPGTGGGMRTIRTVAELRAPSQRARARVGLVPTMGAFHAGHESLIAAAREEHRPGRRLAVRQPRPVQRPARPRGLPPRRAARRDIADELGADVLFAPAPRRGVSGRLRDHGRVAGLSDVLEGDKRGPGHFAGVCTVVAKLFNMVRPDVAYFGQKDAQQVAVLRRMVKDLDFPLKLDVRPTDPRARRPRALQPQRPPQRGRARQGRRPLPRAARRRRAAACAAGRAVLAEYGIEPEYFAMVDPDTFEEPGRLAVIAATIGGTRLIDNVLTERAATPDRRGADPKGAVSVLPTS